jgi:thiol-disulfide isomerase/thioredoxin
MHTDVIVQHVRLDQPLADELFEIELQDGVPVATDWRYDPPIRYTYRKDQAEKERLALCEAAKQEQAAAKADTERRQAVIRSRMGTAPPLLPTTGWLSGEPLSWEKLRGKVVVLHFWDIHCAPCQNDLPILARWHETRDESAIVVIGVHRQTDELDAVRKKLADFAVDYPVLIDTPPEKAGGVGMLHDWFGSTWWPHTVLINKRGLVAGHGQLWMGDVAKQIRKLAAEAD